MIKSKNNLLTFILAVGTFSILNTEMGVVGIIPQVAERFAVSVPEAGMLVSGFALIVAIAGPTMPLLFSKVNRKTVMLLTLGVFSLCNIASVFAPTFELLLALRVIPAALHPLYTSMALSVAAQAPDAAQAAKNTSRVFVGVSAGMVLGAPVASLLAATVSLEASLAFFAVVTVAVFALTVFLVPSMPVTSALSYGKQLATLKRPVLWASIFSVMALNGAMFGFYSYLADFLGSIAGLAAAGVSSMLLAYGIANIVGNLIAGRTLATAPGKTVALLPFALIIAYIGLFFFGQAGLIAAGIIIVLGVFAGIGGNVNQYLVTQAAPDAPDFANGLFLTAANLGTTVGTAFCGTFIAAADARFSLIGTVALLAVSVALIAVRQVLARRIPRASIPKTLPQLVTDDGASSR